MPLPFKFTKEHLYFFSFFPILTYDGLSGRSHRSLHPCLIKLQKLVQMIYPHSAITMPFRH